jgi:hypothetical protein
MASGPVFKPGFNPLAYPVLGISDYRVIPMDLQGGYFFSDE